MSQRLNMKLSLDPAYKIRDLNSHGLYGTKMQRQHMMMDDKWSPDDINEQMKLVNQFMATQLKLRTIQNAKKNEATVKKYQKLRKDCRNGYGLLSKIRAKANSHYLRIMLKDSKKHRCLYQNMPVRQVLENVDNQTFGLRKEYDSLQHRQIKLEDELTNKRLALAQLHNIEQFNNKEEEEHIARVQTFDRNLANSATRLKAFETINSVYKKIIKILKHDEIFYGPILNSLNDDMIEQKTIIEYILNLGKPAMQSFQQLQQEYKVHTDTTMQHIQKLLSGISESKTILKKINKNKPKKLDTDESTRLAEARDRYMHTTKSLAELKAESERLEDIMKQIEFVTVCSTSKVAYQRIKGQIDQNYKLKKDVIFDSIRRVAMETRHDYGNVLKQVIENNLTQAETHRLNRIKYLKELIAKEEAKENRIQQDMRKNNDFFVMIRFFLWNLYDMLHHVYKYVRLPKIEYTNSYLKLPLLKFEMMNMRAYPPDTMIENLDMILAIINRKLSRLMSAYNKLIRLSRGTRTSVRYRTMAFRDAYINDYIQRARASDYMSIYQPVKYAFGYGASNRTAVPKGRAGVKAQSLQLVQERKETS